MVKLRVTGQSPLALLTVMVYIEEKVGDNTVTGPVDPELQLYEFAPLAVIVAD